MSGMKPLVLISLILLPLGGCKQNGTVAEHYPSDHLS